jgi:plastocyanin
MRHRNYIPLVRRWRQMVPVRARKSIVLLTISFALCLAVLGLAASTSVEAQSNAVQVSIVSGASTLTTTAYSPDVITVVIGVNNTVVWKNNDNAIHTATGTNFTGFSTGNIQPGATASYTFNTAGTYPYHCIYHTGMVGTVIVKGSAVTAASGGGGIPEFPYQTIALVVFTVLIAASYLLVRRHAQL